MDLHQVVAQQMHLRHEACQDTGRSTSSITWPVRRCCLCSYLAGGSARLICMCACANMCWRGTASAVHGAVPGLTCNTAAVNVVTGFRQPAMATVSWLPAATDFKHCLLDSTPVQHG
jgi:hypothetical protein